MKTLNTKQSALIAVIAMLAGFICKADEPPLKLHGKTLTVYPIVLARPDKAIGEKTQKFGERIAEVVGLRLEQHGMLPGVSAEYPETIGPDDPLAEVKRKFQTFVEGEAIETDYALFAFFGVKPSKRGPAVARICVALADATGRIVWSKDITEIPEGRMGSPLGATVLLSDEIRSASDLKEGDTYGSMARLMDQRNGLPPKPERDAMDKRFEAAHDSFSEAALSVYPFRIWETEKGSVEGAEALAEKLTDAGLFRASAVDTDTQLVATRDPDQPSQMKIIWDTARDFRNYLREHPADADYALLVDVTIPTHHVHLVLCEGSGDWVTVSLMNSHHPEFQEVDPKTLEDCVELAFRRLTATIQGQKEQEELAKEVAAYKPDPRHTGKYADQNDPSNYIELKPDGSFHVHQDGREMEGSFAVVKGNRVILTLPGRGSRPVGRIEGNKLLQDDGDVWIKIEDGLSTPNEAD